MSNLSFFDPRVISYEENYTLETECGDPKIRVTGARKTMLMEVRYMGWNYPSSKGQMGYWSGPLAPVVDADLEVKCANGVTYSLVKRFVPAADAGTGWDASVAVYASAAEEPAGQTPASEMNVIPQPEHGRVYVYAKPKQESPLGSVITIRPSHRTIPYPIATWQSQLKGLDFGLLPTRDPSLRGRLDRPVLLVHGRGRDYKDWGIEIARPTFENFQVQSVSIENLLTPKRSGAFASQGWIKEFLLTTGTRAMLQTGVEFRLRHVPPIGSSEVVSAAALAGVKPGTGIAEIDGLGRPWIVWNYTVTRAAYEELKATIQADPSDDRTISLQSSVWVDGTDLVTIEVKESKAICDAIQSKLARDRRKIAFQQRWVQNYQDGTLPDILARARGLDTRFDPADPASGINHNGIYFHNAPVALNDTPRVVPLQHEDLRADLERALTDHYGSSWTTNPRQQIDLVCHSQGCLIARDLLRNAASLPAQGAANAANHIRKIVSVNSPHFGSALVSTTFSDEAQRGKYEGATTVFRDLLFNEHRIANGEADFGNARFAGAVGRDWATSIQCEPSSEATACGIAQPTVFVAGFFTGLLGRLFGTYDVNFTLDGKLLGPWKWDIRTRGESVADDVIEGNPSTQSSILTNVEAGDDLGQTAPFITTLGQAGFPARPDGSLVQFLPFYSASTRDLTAQIASQIAHDMVGVCEEDYVRGLLPAEKTGVCFSIAGEVEAYADELARKKDAHVDNVRITPEVRFGLWTLREKWLSTSDLLVEAESQNPTDRGAFDTRLPLVRAALDPARNFPLRRGLARGSRDTMVVHGPFQIEDNPVGTGPLMRQRGSLRMGLDLFCALDQVCDTYLAKANVSFPTGHPLGPSNASNPLLAARSATPATNHGRGYTFVGDFDQAVLDVGNNLQALEVADRIQAQRQGEDLVVACAGHKTQVFPGLGPASLWVRRSGEILTVGLQRPDGGSWSEDLVAPSGALEVRLTWNNSGASPLLAGSGVETDTLNQASTGGAVVVHREAAPDFQASLPQGLVYNGTSDSLRGFELAYHFSADPVRHPQAQILHAPDADFVLEFLGGEDWRLVLRSTAKIAPRHHWPTDAPWAVRLSYADGTTWNLWDDPSRYRNLGFIAENPWIPLRDGRGILLWGEVPPSSLRTALDPTPHLEAWARADQGLSPWLRSQIRIKNLGSRSIGKIRLTLPFRVPAGQTPTLEDWHTPEATLRLLDRGAGRWELEALFDQHLISAGSTVDLGEWGVRLDDWSNWSGLVMGDSWQPHSKICLWDSTGALLWGQEDDATDDVDPPSTGVGTMGVELRDESPTDPYVLRPRVRLSWQGDSPLQGFRMRGQFASPPGVATALDLWFPPPCTGTVEGAEAVITCSGVSLAPGSLWPDQAGAVFGLHHTDWSTWDRTDDPSFSGLTGAFQPWSRLRVERLDGSCLAGCVR